MNAMIEELSSREAPGKKPQPIAFHEGTLWLGCWDTPRLFAIDPKEWRVTSQVELPGIPYGLAAFDGALRIVVSIGEADDRYIYRHVPGKPLSDDDRVACPEFTGSHLTSDGVALYLMQQTNRRMLEIAADGSPKREFPLTTRCAGMTFRDGRLYMIAADADFDVLEFATLDLIAPNAEPAKIAPMNVESRGLAFDGAAWWTSRREDNLVVSFHI